MAGLINKWVESAAAGQESRPAQLKVLESSPEPNRKGELWRYSDVTRLQNLPISTERNDTPEVAADWVLVVSESGVQGLDSLPEGMTVSPITNAQSDQRLDADPELSHVFYNQAAFSNGLRLRIESNAPQGRLLVRYDLGGGDQWQLVRNEFQLAAGSQLHVSESHEGGHLNVVNFFELANGAKLQRDQIMNLSATDSCLSFNQFDLGDEAVVRVQQVHQGGHIQHHMHHVNFNGQRAEYVAGSINKGSGKDNIADLIQANHHQKNNRSEVVHRSIANDQAQVFNQATALVAVGADQSEIAQDLKNILLSEDAKIFSKPALEVYADEVVAAHGSTIGALDDHALFYLQSRGIDIEQARQIMIESFEEEAKVC